MISRLWYSFCWIICQNNLNSLFVQNSLDARARSAARKPNDWFVSSFTMIKITKDILLNHSCNSHVNEDVSQCLAICVAWSVLSTPYKIRRTDCSGLGTYPFWYIFSVLNQLENSQPHLSASKLLQYLLLSCGISWQVVTELVDLVPCQKYAQRKNILPLAGYQLKRFATRTHKCFNHVLQFFTVGSVFMSNIS